MTAPRRVLLIDDTPEIAELLTFALRDHGYEVVSTGFTDTVNQMVVDERADALVLDCSVYEMSESLFDMVRDDPAHAELPVVVISDTPDKADRSLRARQADPCPADPETVYRRTRRPRARPTAVCQ